MSTQLDQLKNTIAQMLPTGRTEYSAYELGYDCGVNGADETNCHFSIFSQPEYMRAWERGKSDADAGRRKVPRPGTIDPDDTYHDYEGIG